MSSPKATRRNSSQLNEIAEEQSIDFAQDLNLEFEDSDDESISLSLGDAIMVGDDELLMAAQGGPSPETASETGEEASLMEEEDQSPPQKTLTEQIQKRTGRTKVITWALFCLLGLGTFWGCYFITRHEDCQDKIEEVRSINQPSKSCLDLSRLTPISRFSCVPTVCVAKRFITFGSSTRRRGPGPCSSYFESYGHV